MEHSSFATELLDKLDETYRTIALAEAENCLLLTQEDLAILVGYLRVQTLCLETDIEQLRVQLKIFIEQQEKIAEIDAFLMLIRDKRDAINDKLVDYGANLIEEKSKRKKSLSNAGTKGANAKNKSTNDLKTWALEEVKKMHGNDKANSKALFDSIPEKLKQASDDAERLIYEALLAARKEDKLKRQAGHT